jgi:hypothetical protein
VFSQSPIERKCILPYFNILKEAILGGWLMMDENIGVSFNPSKVKTHLCYSNLTFSS